VFLLSFGSENGVFHKSRREKLGNLGFLTKIALMHDWSDLHLPPENVKDLKEILSFVEKSKSLRSRESGVSPTRGVVVLFVGDYGVGKNVAVENLARDLGVEAYRVDLSTVISKYIGETEKNLDRIFAAAEVSGAVLFFDEADALFGKRTNVKDSHDRYSNLEVNFLLRKIGEQSGTVIIAARNRSGLDDAFLRRLNFVVDFPSPNEDQRGKNWKGPLSEKKPLILSPGVYVEEVEAGAKPIEGVGTDVVGFLGETERGPTFPRLIHSWVEYRRVFGGFFGEDKYLPYAVEGFFKNGGKRCYITRVVKPIARRAEVALVAESEGEAFKIVAVGEGAWGKRVAVKVKRNDDGASFRLSVFYWSAPVELFDPELSENADKQQPEIMEVFESVSVDPSLPDFYGKVVSGMSNLIELTGVNGGAAFPGDTEIRWLSGKTGDESALVLGDYLREDITVPGQSKGLRSFEDLDDISLVYVPNVFGVQGLYEEVVSHCELLKDRFAIVDVPKGITDFAKPGESKFAAAYFPWIKVVDSSSGNQLLVPPGGFVAGVYARVDSERGVQKAPANEVVRGAVGLEFLVSKDEQDVLNSRGINCIRDFGGRGIRIWGARTLSSDSTWKYVNIRRLLTYLEQSIEKGIGWVVFEPNNEGLWNMVKQSIAEFLMRCWRQGAFVGSKPDEAFFVKCDRTTMSQDDIDNGRIIMIVGVAPLKPAEFVIFRIGQWTDGSELVE
jgi:phage tail sheath protein FI